MNEATRTICFALVFAFLCLACVGCVAETAQQPTQPTSAKTEAELRREEKARAAEEIKAGREAAAKTKREAAAKTKARREEQSRAAEELKARREAAAKAKREAAAKAKREAAAKAKAEHEEKARLAKLDADVEKKAQAEINQAELEKKARLAELDAKMKKQEEQLNAERANIKRKFERDKAELTAGYERTKAETKKDKAKLDAEYKKYERAVARLESEYQTALAKLKEKADIQTSQINRAEQDNKAELAKLETRLKEIKTEQTNLERKFDQDKDTLAAEYKQAKAEAGKDKTKLDAENKRYKQRLAQLETEYKRARAQLEEKAGLQTAQIDQAKRENKAEIATLETKAKEQAKEIKAEETNLERKLKQDKKEQEKNFGLAKLAADYMEKAAQLEAKYVEAVAELEERTTADYAAQKKQIEDDYDVKVAKVNVRLRLRREAPLVAQLELPEDTTPSLTVRALRISGNSLISTAELLRGMPSIYNASAKPLREAESNELFDLRILQDIIIRPGQPREVSTRTIRGFTQYLLSVYQDKNYAGVYVYVPSEALKDGRRLQDEILPVNVLEASVSEVTTTYFNPKNEKVEKGLLSSPAVIDWSPAKGEQPANQKELDDFVNLLNLNPDRYVSAVVSKGAEPNSIAVGYNIYEANPWHWFVQVDNSGTRERQWNPRVGVINTNLLGIDDTFTTIYQAPWDSTLGENYGMYGSYDFPLLGPRLRLNLYGGHSEFDISPEAGPFDFLGRGSFYGGILRYNLFQDNGWFFDIKSSLEHTKSKVTPSLFPSFLGTNVRFWLLGSGVDLHHSDDISQSSFRFDRFTSLGGESGLEAFRLARTNSETDFTIYTASAAHTQYMDSDKVGRLSGSFRWITSDERLVPAKMTSFGGMYSVRGYDEYEAVADGGILASVQYEFDLVKFEKSKEVGGSRAEQEQQKNPFVRKLAPLVFFDYGRAKTIDPVGTDKAYEELFSVGAGAIVELGDNFSGAVYYGYPLNATDTTREGKGRVNVGVMMRW
jgi:hemolysin activation/secretion protein